VRSRLLWIGTSTYRDQDLGDMPGVLRNLDRLAALFGVGAGRRSTDGSVMVLPEPDTPEAIRAAVQAAVDEADDLLLVYYAGHGITGAGPRRLRLAASASTRHNDGSALEAAELCRVMAAAHARTVVLILDCCFAGRVLDDPGWEGIEEDRLLVWASAPPGQPAQSWHETPEGFDGRSPTAFTQTLIAALESRGASLTLPVLAELVQNALAAQGHPAPGPRGSGGATTVLPIDPHGAGEEATFTGTSTTLGPIRIGPWFLWLAMLPLLVSIGVDVLGRLGWQAALHVDDQPWVAPAVLGPFAVFGLPHQWAQRRFPKIYVGAHEITITWHRRRAGRTLLWRDIDRITLADGRYLRVRLRDRTEAIGLCDLRSFGSMRGRLEAALRIHATWRWEEADV
jgi:hypothetical protein